MSNLNGSAAAVSPSRHRPRVSVFADCSTFLSRGMAAHAASEQKKQVAWRRRSSGAAVSGLCCSRCGASIVARYLKLGCHFQAGGRAAHEAHSALWGTAVGVSHCSRPVLETVAGAPGPFSLFSN